MNNQESPEDKVFTERLYFIVALVILLLVLVFSAIYLISKNRRDVNTLQIQISELKNRVYSLTEMNSALMARPKSNSGTGAQKATSTIAEMPVANDQKVICLAFAYSDWSSCSAAGEQTRIVIDSLPAGCVDGDPFLARKCSTPAGG